MVYQIKLPVSWGIHNVFHASLLLPYHEMAGFGPNFSHSPPDLISGEKEYKIEQILNHRHHGRARKLQYFIKWKEYPESDNTWKPADQAHMSDLVKAYHRLNPLKHKKGRTAAMNHIFLPFHSPPTKSIRPSCLLKNPPTPAVKMMVRSPDPLAHPQSLSPTILWTPFLEMSPTLMPPPLG